MTAPESPPPADALTLEDVAVHHGETRLAGPVGLSVVPGTATTLMGPSGSGKSSILAYVTGTLAPGLTGTGRVLIGAREVTHLPPERREIGILFQDDLLFPHMSVGENLGFALPRSVRDRAERRRRVSAALTDIALDGFEDRDPATLSGGQRARVALARALMAEPRALLLDEPFSKLDQALRGQVRKMVFDLGRAKGLPILLVTHDPADAEAAEGPIIVFGEA
ncbi:MAG: ATP-binding cassette domain-containing protein [Alphaproteobacteria bacterium]|nr:ATP-binding cassette domain-containing protein [Alphaproteobacteria bacterium]